MDQLRSPGRTDLKLTSIAVSGPRRFTSSQVLRSVCSAALAPHLPSPVTPPSRRSSMFSACQRDLYRRSKAPALVLRSSARCLSLSACATSCSFPCVPTSSTRRWKARCGGLVCPTTSLGPSHKPPAASSRPLYSNGISNPSRSRKVFRTRLAAAVK